MATKARADLSYPCTAPCAASANESQAGLSADTSPHNLHFSLKRLFVLHGGLVQGAAILHILGYPPVVNYLNCKFKAVKALLLKFRFD